MAEVEQESYYPQNLHPGLAPGIDVERKEKTYRVDILMLSVLGVLVTAFVIWGVLDPKGVLNTSTVAIDWIISNLGWLFTVVIAGATIFLFWLAFSRYGRIPLGVDGAQPQFTMKAWVALLFSVGLSSDVIFFATYEPLYHYLSPRPGTVDPATTEAVKKALSQSALHWGINAWALYAIVGVSVAYVSFRKGRLPLISSVIVPLFKKKYQSPAARIIDGLAIVATLFGTAASLGIAAMQIAHGTELITGIGRAGNGVLVGIITVLTIITIASAASGIARGVRYLSTINLFMSVTLAFFIFVVGPTAFLTNMIPSVIIDYIGGMPDALSATVAESPQMKAFLSAWTTFYWAWWVSWAPFVGIFVAKISRGRTIRQFVLGVMLIPAFIVIIFFTIVGGTGIFMQRTACGGGTCSKAALAADNTVGTLPAPEEIFYRMMDNLPGGAIVSVLVVILFALFYITSANSAAIVNAQMSESGNPRPRNWMTAFWGVCMGGIATVMLLAGGHYALQALRNLVVITALPFAVVIILICVSLYLEIRRNPYSIRQVYRTVAMDNAIKEGLENYGDNFAMDIKEVPQGSPLAAGAYFDSTAEKFTSWYQDVDMGGTDIPAERGAASVAVVDNKSLAVIDNNKGANSVTGMSANATTETESVPVAQDATGRDEGSAK